MANCIYKYKGKDYTKEEFYSLVSNSNFIQQEQARKFAELQERLNNKEFLEGAKNVFESSEELQNVYYEAAGFEIPTTKLEGRKAVEGKLVNFDVIEELASAERSDIPSSILIKKLLNGGYLPKINETDIVLGGLEYGIWRPNLKKIEAQGGNKSTLAKKVGHELLHSVTHNIIYSYQNLKGVVDFNDKYNKDNIRQGYVKPTELTKSQIEALDNLVRIRNKVVAYIEQNKDKIQKQDRGFGTYDYFIRTNYTESETDLHEFISEVFTNPELINILKEIPSEGKKSNLFKDFVDAISKILGFNNTSILEDIIAYSEEAFFAQPQITPQQKQDALNAYTDYIARVSLGIVKNPSSGEYNYESKVQDIVYHGVVKGRDAYNNIIEKGFDFKSKRNWDSPNSKFLEDDNTGMFFSDIGTGYMYGGNIGYRLNEKGEYENFDDSTVIAALLNIEFLDTTKETSSWTAAKFYRENKNKLNIGMFGLEGGSEGVHDNYVVFEPEQIHILSSKADIQGFKDFVKESSKPKVSQITDEYGNTWNEIKLTEKNKEKIFLNKSENKVNNTDKYFKDVIQPLIKTLSKKFPNTKVTIISENELPENLKGKNINSYYKNNEVFIIKEKVTPEITIEEFLHPFVNVLKESNEELYKSLLKEAKQLFPELRADIKDSYKRVYDNKDDIDKEFLTQVLSKKVSQKQLTLFEQFKNWLKELLFGKNDNINLEELDINMKLGDIISILSDNYIFNINDYSNGEFYSQSNDTTNNFSFIESLGKQSGIIDDSFKKTEWSNEVNNLITQQYEFINPSFEQKRSCEKLMSFSNDLAGTTEKNYILKNNTSLDRASTILKQDERFKFNNDEFNEEKYENNRIWGNQIDDILRAVVLHRFNNDNGKIINEINLQREKRNEESLLSEEIVNKLIYEFNQFLKQNENKIALPQIFLYNENKKIGGTADLILVDKFGNCEIIDLKSSVNPTNFNGRYFENYIKTGENGNEYINRYDKAFNNEKASKKERHEAQLSLYAGCLEARAIPLNESKPLQILPIHILNNEDNYVNKINVEKIFSIQLNKEYLNKTNIDSDHNLRIQNNYETDFEYNVNTVILSIKNEIALLKHIKIENTEYSIKELEKMLKILENQNFINSNKLAIYIVELHKTFISGDINFQTKLNYLISDINNKKITDHNLIIEKLLNYKKKVNHFRPLINDLIKFYNEVNENNLNNNDPDSIFSKLIQINTVINQIDEKYEKIIIPFLAENFYQFTDTIPNKNIEQRLNRIQERIDEIKSEYNSKLKESNGQITKDIKKLKERFEKLEDELKIKKRILLTTKEDIINQLKSGSNQDISMLERKFLSPQDSSNVFISGAAQIIDNNNNDLRQKLIEIQEKFLPSYREYAKTKEGLRNNPKEFNEGLFETITVGYFDVITKEFIERQELALVQEKDITKFNKEKQLFSESIKNITDEQEYFKKLNDWYLENTEAIQSKDTIIEGIVIKKGYLSIINSKLQDVNNRLITQKQFDTWYQNTFIIDNNNKITDIKISTKEGKELRQPSSKYTNQKWLDLQKGDISKLNYYNTLVSLLIESKNKYPLNISHEEKFILPQIDKKSYELLKENGIKEFGKDNLKRLFNERESDKKLNYGESTESSIKVIPIMFNDKIDLEKVSVDLAQSILLYSKEANYYESKVKLEPLMTALMLNLSKNTPKKIDSKGRLILKDFAKDLNLPGLDKYINSSSNNIEALFKYYIDNMIYGISREKAVYNTPLGEVDMHSLVDTISGLMANTNMGLPFGLFSNLSNYLQGTVQNSIEAHSEQFFKKSDLVWANKEYLSYSNDFVKNIVDEVPETFIGQLIEIIDPFIGEFKDQFGRKISKSKFRILINSSPFMFFQNIGEHNIQLTMMLALLKSTKLKDEQGKETNLYDVYKNSWNPETKKIEIKSNILSQLGSTTSNGLLSNAFKNKLNYILQSTHGNYAKQTAPEIKKDWYGRVFIFMRNFMATSIAKRWRGEVKNYSIMDMTEGYNRTFWRLMIEEFKEMKKVGFGFHTSKNGIFNSILKTDTSKLTPLELANLRRNAMDMAWVFATGILTAILLGMYKAAGDDDEKSRIAMYLAPVMRLNSELSAFGQIGNPNKGFGFMPDIGDIKRGLMTPTVMYSYITKTFNFVEQIPKDITNLIFEGDIQRYENNSGYYDKGTSKLLADLLKLFGATPGKLDAKEAIKSLYLQQNR